MFCTKYIHSEEKKKLNKYKALDVLKYFMQIFNVSKLYITEVYENWDVFATTKKRKKSAIPRK